MWCPRSRCHYQCTVDVSDIRSRLRAYVSACPRCASHFRPLDGDCNKCSRPLLDCPCELQGFRPPTLPVLVFACSQAVCGITNILPRRLWRVGLEYACISCQFLLAPKLVLCSFCSSSPQDCTCAWPVDMDEVICGLCWLPARDCPCATSAPPAPAQAASSFDKDGSVPPPPPP